MRTRLRLPALLGSMVLIGACAGIALAQDSPPGELEAVAQEIDCSSLDMTPAEQSDVEDCWETELVEDPPPGATEIEIALAEQAALCDAVDATGPRPEFCSISSGDATP